MQIYVNEHPSPKANRLIDPQTSISGVISRVNVDISPRGFLANISNLSNVHLSQRNAINSGMKLLKATEAPLRPYAATQYLPSPGQAMDNR